MLDRPRKLKEYQTYIGGKWVDAASGKRFETSDPYTGEAWALIPECDKADADKAVEAAARAFETGPWPAMTQSARGKVLRSIAGLIEKHAARANTGRPRSLAMPAARSVAAAPTPRLDVASGATFRRESQWLISSRSCATATGSAPRA